MPAAWTVERAIRSGADGIGLFRSEFLYTQRQDGFPDEQVQTAAYARAAELCGGRPLVIRTLDIGGDKSLPYYRFPEEENPFLGWRAIRVSLELRDMFRTQLRAILRASARGGVRVMFPMIVSPAELCDALALWRSARRSCAGRRCRSTTGFRSGDDRDAGGGVHGRRTGRRGRFFSASAPTTSRSTCWPSIRGAGGSRRCTIRCIRPWCARGG